MTNDLVNKNDFLKKFKADYGRKAKELNNFIFNWCKAGGDTEKVYAWIKSSEEKDLEKGALYWLYLLHAEAEAFRDQKNNETFVGCLEM